MAVGEPSFFDSKKRQYKHFVHIVLWSLAAIALLLIFMAAFLT